jgi:hypothetical protein
MGFLRPNGWRLVSVQLFTHAISNSHQEAYHGMGEHYALIPAAIYKTQMIVRYSQEECIDMAYATPH